MIMRLGCERLYRVISFPRRKLSLNLIVKCDIDLLSSALTATAVWVIRQSAHPRIEVTLAQEALCTAPNSAGCTCLWTNQFVDTSSSLARGLAIKLRARKPLFLHQPTVQNSICHDRLHQLAKVDAPLGELACTITAPEFVSLTFIVKLAQTSYYLELIIRIHSVPTEE